MMSIYLLIVLSPLVASLVTGLFGWAISRRSAHCLAIGGVGLSTVLSVYTLIRLSTTEVPLFNETIYTWLTIGGIPLSIGFWVDLLTAVMLTVVTTVSLIVHIYTVGYMAEDSGYKRFFSYISLFTFAMLVLVMSNNFVQLFFGWEAVGLVSYLLIGFWFKRPSANFASLKAFLINRVSDLGFLLGIGLISVYWAGTLDYSAVFAAAPLLRDTSITLISGMPCSLMSTICLLLFVGAMGKSAQFPLHVWLPDSMEGPTPISALIHAATMVTAGIFMVARVSPLFELSDTALNFMLVVGAITALFMGLLGIVQNDIKRVIAYSTLSQLGYMTVALGASVYHVAIFHVFTHAFFKALLFLAAGTVIIGMHHEQDMRRMGNLRRYMPITWITFLLGSLSLVGTPFFSGFYSKDSIIEAVHMSHLSAAPFAWYCTLIGVFITTLYTFRMYFMVFHGKSRWPTTHAPHENKATLTGPLIVLAIPSVIIGYCGIDIFLNTHFFDGTIDALRHPAAYELMHHFSGAFAMGTQGLTSLPSLLVIIGLITAWLCYIRYPHIPKQISETCHALYTLLKQKYYMDALYLNIFAEGAQRLGRCFWKIGDVFLIDGLIVNGTATRIGRLAGLLRKLQTGYIYTYALAMVIGLLALLIPLWWFNP